MVLGYLRKRLVCGLLGAAALTAWCSHQSMAGDHGERPVGGNQKEFKGKLWPPFPRPAGKEAGFWQQYHYAHYWPHPQSCEDRSSVRAALNMQVSNGWVEGTTLFSYHFNAETNQLNSAGLAHLEYILFRVPGQYRTAFVQMTGSAQNDQLRLANVQASATGMLNDGNLPPIALRRARAYGAAAAEVDMISRQYISSTPSPRLSATSGGTSASSASQSNSND